VRIEKATLQIDDEWSNGGVAGIEQQNLVSCNYGFNVLQIDHNRSVSAKNGGGIREQRVQYAKVSSWKASAVHDVVFPASTTCVPPWLSISSHARMPIPFLLACPGNPVSLSLSC